tara:strand:+ start:4583 stop:5530 length:948 start_codon:yes stop_codon:yes gene_type:complete
MIKPEFWSSEDILELTIEARLFYIGFWNFCDDSGVLPDKPKSLKCNIYPAEVIDCKPIINSLVECNLLVRYKVGTETYLRVNKWHKHQSIKHPTYKFPLENGEIPTHVRYKVGTCTEGVRLKEKEKEKKKEKEKLILTHTKDKAPSGECVSVFNFEDFWESYAKEGNALKCSALFNRLDNESRQVIKSHLPGYVESTQDEHGRYRMNPDRYLSEQAYLIETPRMKVLSGDKQKAKEALNKATEEQKAMIDKAKQEKLKNKQFKAPVWEEVEKTAIDLDSCMDRTKEFFNKWESSNWIKPDGRPLFQWRGLIELLK